jgi:O-antigen ligase
MSTGDANVVGAATSARRTAARAVREDPLLLPGLLAFGVFVAWAVAEAGYAPTTWYPGTLFLVLLAAVTLAGIPVARPSRIVAASLGLFAAFTGWSFLSITWAQVKGDAWDGANRTLLYLVVYAFFVLVPWRPLTVAVLMGAYSLAIGAIGAIVLVLAARASDPSVYFQLGRFASPSEYQNANCALFLAALTPALFLAAKRETPVVVRALMLANCGVLLELALLTQSRASVVALPMVLVVYFALVPDRARGLLVLAAAGAAAAACSGRLLHVFSALEHEEGVRTAVSSARTAVLATAAVLALLGAVAAALDRRLAVPERLARWGSRTVVAAAGLAVAATLVVFAAASGNPIDRATRAWDEFKATNRTASRSSYFANGFGSNRYDIWRVALDEFRARPLQGAGPDNFAVAYLRERRSDEEPLYPHSLELQLLQQTGLVGTVLFFGFLVLAMIQLAPLRRAPPFVRGVAVSTGAVFVYWFVHGSVDWFWDVPALSAPAFAALGLAAAVVRKPWAEPSRGRRPALAWSAAAVAVVAAACTLAPPWLSAAEVQAAARSWRNDPGGAFARLHRARQLNPLADNPDLVAGAIASRLGDSRAMQAAFEHAVSRNPTNWYAWLELALAENSQGERGAALRHLARARALDPREPTIREVAADVAAGRTVQPRRIDRILLRRINVH